MGQEKTIQINGTLYDSVSGQEISVKKSTASSTSVPLTNNIKRFSPKIAQGQSSSGVVLDGFTIRKNVVARRAAAPIREMASKSPSTSTHSIADSSNSIHDRSPKNSQRLMRSTTKKPSASPQPEAASNTVHVTHDNILPVTGDAQIRKNQLAVQYSNERAQRAAEASKNTLVSKFSETPQLSETPTTESQIPTESLSHKIEVVPIKAPPIHHQIQHSATEGHFSRALELASAHELKPLKKRTMRHKAAHHLGISPKTAGIAGASLVAILVASVVAYNNVPNFALKLASSKAGFAASLPSNIPSGYSLNGPIQYSPGQVSTSYKSNTNGQNFSINQRPSNWNEESLKSNVLGVSTDNYDFNSDEVVIHKTPSGYSWLKNGKLYTLGGDAEISNEQIKDIVKSL